MRRFLGRGLTGLLAGVLLAGCGGGSDTLGAGGGVGGSAGTGGSAGSGGGQASGGQAGSNGGAAGSAGSGGATGSGGSAGTTGTPRLCAGAFVAEAPLFSANTTVLSSLAITGDELELYFSALTAENPVMVVKRASKAEPFTAATPVPDLDVRCDPTAPRTLDVSPDGLRVYLECSDGPGPLFLATRPDRNSPFVFAEEPIGTVGNSIAISTNELVAYAIIHILYDARPVMYRRASLAEPFGPEEPVPGLTGEFRHPEPSLDENELFGTLMDENGHTRLGVALRSGATFSQPISAGMPTPPAMTSDYTPTVSGDCRSLYFLRENWADPGTSYWTVHVATR